MFTVLHLIYSNAYISFTTLECISIVVHLFVLGFTSLLFLSGALVQNCPLHNQTDNRTHNEFGDLECVNMGSWVKQILKQGNVYNDNIIYAILCFLYHQPARYWWEIATR